MDVDARADGEVTFLLLRGTFDTVSLPGFSAELESLIEGGAKKVCLNFRDVSFINSTALGYLVQAAQRMKDSKGELVFSEPSDFFAATVRTLELHHIFEVFSTDAEAVEHFRNRG